MVIVFKNRDEHSEEEINAIIYQVYQKDEIHILSYGLLSEMLPIKESIAKAFRLKTLLEEKGIISESGMFDDTTPNFCSDALFRRPDRS